MAKLKLNRGTAPDFPGQDQVKGAAGIGSALNDSVPDRSSDRYAWYWRLSLYIRVLNQSDAIQTCTALVQRPDDQYGADECNRNNRGQSKRYPSHPGLL
jgi:hypothetical protein